MPKFLTKAASGSLRNGEPRVHVKQACREEVSAASTAGCKVASTMPEGIVNSTAKILHPANLCRIDRMQLYVSWSASSETKPVIAL